MSRRRIVRAGLSAAVLAVVATLAACGGSSGGTAAVAPSVGASPAAVTCPSPATTTTPPGTKATVVSGGLDRTYYVWLPTGYTGAKPVPVIVDYHGTGGNGLNNEQFSGLAPKAIARGYLVVAPDAVPVVGASGEKQATGWRVPGVSLTPNDVQFTADMLRAVEARYCVDPSRLYATGFSSGGAMTGYVSCTLDVWAAVAPMSAVNLTRPCPAQPSVPMVTFHGTNDQFVAYQGQSGFTNLNTPNTLYIGPVPYVVDQWAKRNGCAPQRIDTPVVPTVTKRTYAGCKAGDDVVLYTIQGTGHAYPGGPPISAAEAAQVGGQSQAIDAAKVLLDFFDAHTRPAPAVIPSTVDDPAVPVPAAGATVAGSAAAGVAEPLPTITAP